jgi:hypothetical protein
MLLQRNEHETANGDKGEDELLTVELSSLHPEAFPQRFEV